MALRLCCVVMRWLAVAVVGVVTAAHAHAQAQPQTLAPPQSIVCDVTGVIECQVVERVAANKSLEDLRVIAKFVALVSERNRRYYAAFAHRSPSAAYEVVRLVRTRPWLPNGDSYGIVELKIVLREDDNVVAVRYPRRPDGTGGWIAYEAPLVPFMHAVEAGIVKLKKYDKDRP